MYIIRHEFEISVNKLCQLLKHFTKSISQIHHLMLLYHRSSELSTLFTKSAEHYVFCTQDLSQFTQDKGRCQHTDTIGTNVFAARFIVEDHLCSAL